MFQSYLKPTKAIKKRKSIPKIGKKGKRNIEVNKILKKEYAQLPELSPCEIQNQNLCWNQTHGFAHRHQKNWYLGREHLLAKVNQTLKACNPCHDWMDAHREEREAIFLEKRGVEILE